MSQICLEVVDLVKSFDKIKVLNGVSLSVKSGTIFGLVGLNGVGKTTLIRCCLGLHIFESGSVKILGRDSLDTKSREKLSFLPDAFSPSPFVNAYEFIKFTLSVKNEKFDKKAVDELAQRLDLPLNYLKYKTNSLSRGTLQKIGLLNCFISQSPLIILDEPMNGLDVRARIMLKEVLKDMRASGRTVIFSSHILSDMAEICDEVGIFHAGNFKFISTLEAFKIQTNKPNLEEGFMQVIE